MGEASRHAREAQTWWIPDSTALHPSTESPLSTQQKDKLLLLSQTNKNFSNSAALCFMEIWLNDAIPDSALHLPNFQLIRFDRKAESTEKSCGSGTCFYINERRCTDVTVLNKRCAVLI